VKLLKKACKLAALLKEYKGKGDVNALLLMKYFLYDGFTYLQVRGDTN